MFSEPNQHTVKTARVDFQPSLVEISFKMTGRIQMRGLSAFVAIILLKKEFMVSECGEASLKESIPITPITS